MADPSTRRRWGWSLTGLLASFAVVCAPMLLPEPWRDAPSVQLASLFLCVFAALPFFYFGWRNTDEVINRAHKDAFIAGGSLGGLVTLVALTATLILMKPGMTGPFGVTQASVVFMLVGVLLSLAITTFFYGVFLVLWWR